MLTYEEIYGFLKDYQERLEKYQQLTDSLLLPNSHEEWMKILEERSDVIREAFARNEEWFPKIYADLEQMTFDKAKKYYNAVVNIFNVGYSYFDFPFAIDILERLEPVLEAEAPIPFRLALYGLLIYMCSTYYDVMMGTESRMGGLKYAEKMVACRKYYVELADDDTDSRMDIWFAYDCLLGTLAEIYEVSFETLAGRYDDMTSSMESDTVQRIDGNNEEIIYWMEQAKNAFLATSYEIMRKRLKYADRADYKHCLKDIEGKLQPILEEYVSDAFDEAHCSRCLLDIVNGKKDAGELVYQAADELEACDFDGAAQKSHDELCVLLNDLLSAKLPFFWNLLGMAALGQNEKQQLADRVSRLFFRNMREVPSTFEKETIDKEYAEFFCEVLPYLGTFREKKDMLEKLITCRQPQTFIHSCMVGKLAVMAAESIIEKAPEIFADIPGYETAELLREKKEEFLSYIGNCGAFHDIGKCEVAGVINMQMHKVTDLEFACIKRHPWCGVKALENDADFAPYIPVILGHHKTYDGTRGYPADFDVLSSPYKPVIDLISICDSLDAATDHLGRNYNKAKTFDVVLEEFKQGAGTRYNPDIVKVIEEDAALQEKMRHLVTDGRADAYFEAYQQCQKIAEMTIEK